MFMTNVNTITFCLRDYDSVEDGMKDVCETIRILLDAGYITTVRYDEPGLKILCVEFESADKSLGAAYPYWLTPEQVETLYYADTDNEDDSNTKNSDSIETYTPEEIRNKLNSNSEQNCIYVDILNNAQDYTTPAVQKYVSRLSENELTEFRSSWQSILYEDGVLDVNQMMRELIDYSFILKQLPTIYSEITNGTLSKPFYTADTVLKLFREHFREPAALINLLVDDWDIIVSDCETKEEIKQKVFDYLEIAKEDLE